MQDQLNLACLCSCGCCIVHSTKLCALTVAHALNFAKPVVAALFLLRRAGHMCRAFMFSYNTPPQRLASVPKYSGTSRGALWGGQTRDEIFHGFRRLSSTRYFRGMLPHPVKCRCHGQSFTGGVKMLKVMTKFEGEHVFLCSKNIDLPITNMWCRDGVVQRLINCLYPTEDCNQM